MDKRRYHKIAGVTLALIGVIGSITLDESKYSIIALLGVIFLLLAANGTAKD